MPYNELLKGRFSEPGREYFITTVVRDRKKVFTRFFIARLFIQELMRNCENGTYTWLAWVVMPDHFHGLLSLGESDDLQKIMQQVKGRSARLLNNKFGVTGQSLWQKGFYDHALRREEDRKTIARYIVMNPVRAGLVASVYEYPHWDAVWMSDL